MKEDHAGQHREHRHELDRERNLADDSFDDAKHECEVDRRDVRVFLDHRALHRGGLRAVAHPRRDNEEARRFLERAFRKHDEEICLKPPPIHSAQICHARFDGDAMHIPDDLIADPHAEVLGDPLLNGDGNNVIRGRNSFHPFAGYEFFRVSEVIAIGRAVFAAKGPFVRA
jgi:hypothetical protein